MITDDQVKAIEALAEKYPGHYMEKFCHDPRRWDREAERLAAQFSAGDVLDIGCGFGYFVNACDGLGCNAWGLDVFDRAIGEAAEILRAKVVFEGIEADRRLPGIAGGRFDLITMFGCMLRHGHPAESKDYWGWDEYRFFIEDVMSRLRPGGRFVIRPNMMDDPQPHHANLLDLIELTKAVGDIADIEGTYDGQITLSPRKP